MDGGSAETTHDLLLALAGWVDDDLLAFARELVAVDESRNAVELLTATLVADQVQLPEETRAAVVDAGRSTRTELDADTALAPHRAAIGTSHRFDGGPADAVIDALRALPARLLVDCRVSLACRLTPAGSAPGPLPHPVVLIEVTDGSRNRDVLAYQLADALDRAGVGASVEVITAGDELPAYHAEALRNARPVRSGEPGSAEQPSSGLSTPPSGSSGGPPPRPVPVRAGARAGASVGGTPDGTLRDTSWGTDRAPDVATAPSSGATSSSTAAAGTASSGAASSGPASSGPASSGPASSIAAATGTAASDTVASTTATRPHGARPGPHPPATEAAPRPSAAPAESNVRTLVQPGASDGDERPATEPPREHPPADQSSAELPQSERADQPALADVGYRGTDDSATENGPADPFEPADPDHTPEPGPTAVPPTQLVPPPPRAVRHRYLIERPPVDAEQRAAAPDDITPTTDTARTEPPPRPSIGGTQPLSARKPLAWPNNRQRLDRPAAEPFDSGPAPAAASNGGADGPYSGRDDRTEAPGPGPQGTGPRPTPAGGTPRSSPGAFEPLSGELLRPDSMARLSDSGRELLARLQAELRGGPQINQRAGGLTANGGGTGTGTGPQRKVDPPDLAG